MNKLYTRGNRNCLYEYYGPMKIDVPHYWNTSRFIIMEFYE